MECLDVLGGRRVSSTEEPNEKFSSFDWLQRNSSDDGDGKRSYTTRVGILSAATRAPFGHQRDAFGLVVGKLQIKYRTFATFSNTANQPRLYEAQLGEDFPVFPVFCLVIPLRLFESEI